MCKLNYINIKYNKSSQTTSVACGSYKTFLIREHLLANRVSQSCKSCLEKWQCHLSACPGPESTKGRRAGLEVSEAGLLS